VSGTEHVSGAEAEQERSGSGAGAERERSGSGRNFCSPLTTPSVTPAQRSAPAHATSRSRSTVFLSPAPTLLLLIGISGPLRSIFRSRCLSAHMLWSLRRQMCGILITTTGEVSLGNQLCNRIFDNAAGPAAYSGVKARRGIVSPPAL